MIISCNSCNKKFDIDSSLIPEKGRLLQCNSCNHKWFFKKEIIEDLIIPAKIDKRNREIELLKQDLEHKEIESHENIELLDKKNNLESLSDSNTANKNEDNYSDISLKNESLKNKKNYNMLGLTIVFIISFIAIIIVLDTFQTPISKIIPNIEFILYSLYETINDIKLFLKDLI